MSANLSPFHTLGPKKGQWKSFEELVMQHTGFQVNLAQAPAAGVVVRTFYSVH
jgi:hypothetical protein